MEMGFRMSSGQQQSLERLASMCGRSVYQELCAAVSYATAASIYCPEIPELTTSQLAILSFLHGLVVDDIALCCALAEVCGRLRQIQSTFLKVWLRDDFLFSKGDITTALRRLQQLMGNDQLRLPNHLCDTLSYLGSKYSGYEGDLANQVLASISYSYERFLDLVNEIYYYEIANYFVLLFRIQMGLCLLNFTERYLTTT